MNKKLLNLENRDKIQSKVFEGSSHNRNWRAIIIIIYTNEKCHYDVALLSN